MAPNQSAESDVANTPEQPRVALVHVLKPEFHGLESEDNEEINIPLAELVTPAKLRESLLDTGALHSPRLRNAAGKGVSVVSYESGEPGLRWVHLSVTPIEFGLFSRHVDMLARTAINATLASRDKKLRQETADPAATARSDEDIAAAKRAGVRQVSKKLPQMETYLEEQVLPRIETVDRFVEMTRYRNLNRGKHETVREHFEHLRKFVFGDMLDAVGNHRGWSETEANLAEYELQKQLYVRGSTPERVHNFRAMLDLSKEYYQHKQAFILTRIAETNLYLIRNAEAAEDVKQKDEERARETTE